MKKIIDAINNGQINKKTGTLTFSTSAVEHSIKAGTVCEGSFSVYAASYGLVEGYVMSDDYRMECINSEFSGAKDEIAYRFHGETLTPGQEIHGNFVIISNCGEYQVPFLIRIEAEIFDSSLGPVRNVFHFANLAKSNWNEAMRLFYAPGFESIFTGSDREFLPAYKCLSGIPGSEHNMDEFLIAIRKKTPVEFIPSEKSIELNDPVGYSRFSFNISRNGWGYTRLNISVQGDFLSVPKEEITLDDFLGNNYQAYYYVDADKLHAGRNYGEILLYDDRLTIKIPVLVNYNFEGEHFKSMTMNRMRFVIQIMEYYQSFRLKKISSRTWLNETTGLVEKMLANDPEDLIARLYQIHLMITQERFNEAAWNLNKLKPQAEAVREEKAYLWCYFLYLNSLIESDTVDVRALAEEVEYYSKLHPEDWRIVWLLSFMADEYKSAVRRWTVYGETYARGCTSPAMLTEAARIAIENPSVLSSLDGFDLQVIRHICKKDLLTSELIFAIRTLAERYRDYSETVVSLLEYCYTFSPDDELLMNICTLLIRGNRTDKHAFTWYGYAVRQELKITRLYEYYMMSIDKSELRELPRIVLMYFSFHSDLDQDTNAFLYAIVVKDKEKDPDMFSRYRIQIEDFVNKQLTEGRNSRYLSIVYRGIIDEEFLADKMNAARVADVVFMHEIDVSEHPEVRNIILCYGHRDCEEIYPVYAGKAIIPICCSDYCIGLEDAYHNRHSATKHVTPLQLIPPGKILLTLQQSLKDHIELDVNCCIENGRVVDVRPENEFRFRNLLEGNYLSKEYSRIVAIKLMRFYYEQDRIGDLDALILKLDIDSVAEYDRSECVRIMVRRNHYDKALKWIYQSGPEGIENGVISDMLYGWLPSHRDEAEPYKDLLMQLLIAALPVTKPNIACMQFLLAHISGTLKVLRDVWQKAVAVDIDCRDLEEKILIQIMYSRGYVAERGQILEHYAYNLPDGDILKAVLAVCCYEYFVEGQLISEKGFKVLTDAMETDLELQLVCHLAFVKYFAENKSLIDERIRELLKDSLHRLLGEDIILACYKELSDFMPSMAHYADATVIEYRTAPMTRVTIHYIIEADSDDEYHSEPMNEVYGGVYTKAFTLFFGEKLMYYITEEGEEDRDTLSESNTIMRSDIGEYEYRSRFGLINDICIARTLGDYDTVDAMLDDFYRKEFMSERLFGMHKGN